MAMVRVPNYSDYLESIDPGVRERHAEGGAPPGFSDAVGFGPFARLLLDLDGSTPIDDYDQLVRERRGVADLERDDERVELA